ncbi:hypothetical protein PSENEW3_00004996 [Picochlorum sp. SENEW3]|nr:hypothetical protein PSENEW3_00004996 [Picochlorum sp. SENEW3]
MDGVYHAMARLHLCAKCSIPHMSRGGVASRRCEVLLDVLAAFRDMYDTYGGDGWGLSRDGEPAALHKVFNSHMSRGGVASRRCEVLLDVLAAFRGMYGTYGGDGWGLSRDGEAAPLRKVFNSHMSRGGVASRRCEVLLDILAAFRDMYDTYGGDGWGLSRDGEAAALHKVFNSHMSRGGVASRRCEVLLGILAAFRDMYDTYGGDGWGLSRDGEAAPLHKVFNLHMSRGVVASRRCEVLLDVLAAFRDMRCEVLLDVLAAFRDMYDTYGGDGWGLSRDGEAAPLHKVFNLHMSRGGVASRRCEVLLDILAAFRDMYDTYGGDGWGLSRDGEPAALHKVFNSHMSRGGVASRRCEVLLDVLAAFRDMYDTYGGDGWGLSRDGEAAALRKVFNSHMSRGVVASRRCEVLLDVLAAFRDMYDTYGGDGWGLSRDGEPAALHKVFNSHMSRGGVASRRCEVLLDVLAAFRDMYDTYGGDGWGLSRDGEAAALHKVFNSHMSRGGVASRRCEVLLDVLAAFRDIADTYGGDGWGLSRDGEAAALRKVFNSHMSRGGVASRRCEVLLDILAAFRDMYDTYGGDGWGLSRDGEAAALHKVFNSHMSRGGVASRRCEVLLDILAAFRDMYDTYGGDGWGLSRDGEAAPLHKVFNSHMSRGVVASRRCEVLLDVLAAFRDMYDTYGGDGWGLSRDGEAAPLHKVFNSHMSRGGVASRRCEVLLDVLAAFRDMYDTYGGDGWGLSRDGEAAALHKVFNSHMSRGVVASRRCEVLLDVLAAFRDMYDTYGGDGWGLSRDGEPAALHKVFNSHMSRGGVASRRCEVLLDVLAAFRDMYDTYGGDGWGLSRDGEPAALHKVFNSHMSRGVVASRRCEVLLDVLAAFRDMYDTYGGDGWGLSRDGEPAPLHKVFNSHMSRGVVASRRCEVLLDVLAAFRDMYDTYGGDGWGLSRDGEAAALHKVFNSHMSRGGVASRRCEVLLGILAAFRDMYDTYGGDGWGLSRDGEAAPLRKVFNSHMSRGGVASRRCEVLLDVLAAFRDMYDTYGGDGWGLSRDGEPAALHKVFNSHMSRGGVASRRCEVLLDVLAAFRDMYDTYGGDGWGLSRDGEAAPLHKVFNSHMSRGGVASRRCEVLLDILAAFRDMYDTYGGDGWGLSRDGEAAALHKVFNSHMSRGGVASRRCEVLLDILAAFRDMYDTYGGDGWGLSRDGEAAPLHKVFNSHMSRGGVASRRCEVLLDVLAAFRDIADTYGGDGWGLSRDGEAAALRKVFNSHMSRGGVASRRCEVLLDILAAFRDMYDTYGGDGWGLSRDGEPAALHKVFNSHMSRGGVASRRCEVLLDVLAAFRDMYDTYGGDGWGLSRDGEPAALHKVFNSHMSRGVVASRRCEVLLDVLAAFRDMYDTYGGDGWGLSRDGEPAPLHKVFNSHMSRGVVASRRCEVLLDVLAAFRDMYDTYGGDGWGLSRDGEAAALHKVFNSHMSRGGVASRRCEVLLGILAAFRDMYDTYGGDGWGLSRDGEAAPLRKVFINSHMSRGGVASRRCEVLLDVLAAFRDMYDTYGGDGWGLSRDGEPAALHKVFNSHMSRGGVASRRCEVLLDVLAAFRGMYGTYGGDGWGLSRDGEAAPLRKVFNSHMSRGGVASRRCEVLLDILAAFRDMYDTYGGDGWGLSRDGEAAALHKVFNSHMSRGGVASRRCEVLLDILAAFRDMYDTYGGDGWGLSRDGEAAPLHKVFNSHMSRGGVASRRCEVLLDVLAAFRDIADT